MGMASKQVAYIVMICAALAFVLGSCSGGG
jgi:hypothetical protein